jgi:hypothetical protein
MTARKHSHWDGTALKTLHGLGPTYIPTMSSGRQWLQAWHHAAELLVWYVNLYRCKSTF